jgi:hypothetical protein
MKQRRTRAAQQRELSASCATESDLALPPPAKMAWATSFRRLPSEANAGCGARLVNCDSQFNAGARLFHLQ